MGITRWRAGRTRRHLPGARPTARAGATDGVRAPTAPAPAPTPALTPALTPAPPAPFDAPEDDAEAGMLNTASSPPSSQTETDSSGTHPGSQTVAAATVTDHMSTAEV